MPDRIKTSVVACIVDADERVLLTRRSVHPFYDLWIMPGGKIEHGETILDALHREVQEEVGIRIHINELIDVYEHVADATNDDHFVILYYRATPLNLNAQPDGVECNELIWCESAKLPGYNLAPGTKYILGKVFPQLSWLGTTESKTVCSVDEPLACLPRDVE